jgi:hypothetical protein
MESFWKQSLHSARAVGFIVALLAFATLPVAAQVPQDTSFSGRLVDGGGAPLAGPVTFELSVFDAEFGGMSLYSEEHAGVPLNANGNFSVLLGSGTPLSGTFNAGLFSEVDRYVQVDLTSPVSESLVPRVTLASVPWALVAEQANALVADPNAILTTRYRSIPASAFTPIAAAAGWTGSSSGTNRNFGAGTAASAALLAPVELPHGAIVTLFRCGGQDASTSFKISFTLRRNLPQQANVDMAFIESTFSATGFQTLGTGSIGSPVIDNGSYNYYVIAQAVPVEVGSCTSCSVNYCRISYTLDVPYP